MCNKRKSIFCVVMAFFLLFSGMCLENVQTDSSFAYIVENTPISHNRIQEKELVKAQVYMLKRTGVRTMPYAQQFRHRNIPGRRTVKSVSELFYMNQESQIVFNFYMAEHIIQLPELYSKTAVLNYIHNQDGKKRI